jgi:hypothetical protein
MAVTVTTTTATSGGAMSYPPMTLMERAPNTGHLWICLRTTDTTIAVYKSIDNGGSWSFQTSFTRSGLYDIADICIDQAGDHIHMAYLINDGTNDRIIYKRIDIRSGTPVVAAGEIFLNTGPTTTPRAYWYSASIYAYKNPDGTFAIMVFGAYHQPSYSGVYVYGVSIRNDATLSTYANDGIIRSNHNFRLTNDDSSITVSRDVEHNGDGYTTKTPNVWLSFQIHTYAYAVKLTWQGYKTGWASPTTATQIESGRTAVRDLAGRWDGKRFLVISVNPSDTTKLDVWERDAGNTKTVAKRTSPSHPVGGILANMLSYNHVTQDFRLFAVSTSPGPIYYVDFVRATGLWGSWTQAEGATNSVTSEWSVRRGTYGTNQYDVYRTVGTVTPWTVGTYALAVNFAPTAPTWITGTAGTPITNGAAFDVSSSLTLDWTFNDPNTTDTQSQYALRRQIGAGTIQWWRTSDSTWQLAETFNTSATSAVTLTTGQWLGAGGATDPAHVYMVATKDAGSLISPYSSGLSVVPSTRVDPTLTAPTASAILNTGLVNATWTVTEQSAYRVTVTNTATGVIAHDSGWLSDPGATPTILSYIVPTLLADGFTGSLTLQTRNNEGLASVVRTAAFSIDFVEPVAPLITALTADPANGGIQVTVTQTAATGTQPATSVMDLWRRKVVSNTPTNSNPYFETNATDWSNVSYSTAVRSTAFAHTGVASLLCTPTGAAATPYVQTTTIYAATAGSTWTVNGWFRSTTANKVVRLKLQWYNVSSTLISESVRDFTPVAGVWIWMSYTALAPDLTTGVRWACGQTATPAAGDTLYLDEAVLLPANQDDGIRINTGVTSGAANLDWRAVTGTDYEYRAYAEAGNGTRVFGPWTS